MFIHHPQVVSHYVCYSYKNNKNFFRFINFVTLAFIMRNSLKMMYEHRNIWECYKKQILLTYIVHLLDKYSKSDRPMSRPNNGNHLQIIQYHNPEYNIMFLWPCIMNWPYKTTNVMHWILFIRQILLLSSTCFEYQVLIFRRT